MMKKLTIILLGTLPLFASLKAAEFKVASATVGEGFTNPVGYNLSELSFSWKLPLLKNGTAQTAYQIVVASSPDKLPNNPDIWDSKKVESSQSVKVPYGGRELKSRDRMYWMVKVWNEKGKEGAWSDVNSFEAGLLNNADWKGKWISTSIPSEKVNVVLTRKQDKHNKGDTIVHEYPKPAYFRKEFKPAKEISHARLYATARGIYQVSLNGKKIGSAQWVPGWTDYNVRIQTESYDITNEIKDGVNCLGALLGDGWYAGCIGWDHRRGIYGKKPWLLAQIEIYYKDGSSEIIASDDSWKVSSGPITSSDILQGEEYDANLEMPNWNTAGFDASKWLAPDLDDVKASPLLEPRRSQPVSEMLEIEAVSVKEIKDGVFIFDLGQNMTGWQKLVNMPVKKGQRVQIRMAEMLNADGTLYTANYRSARSQDFYTPAEDGEITWEPQLTFHGFRYIEVSGIAPNAKPKIGNVKGVVLYSNMALTGGFKCSNEKLNKLQSNILWGQRGNFLSIPTDCPQRDERLGWTGDAQVFIPTAAFNMNVEGFFTKWAYDMRDAQTPEGEFSHVAPNFKGANMGSAAWSDAGIICPYEIYLAYGNKKILEENYGPMQKWIEFQKNTSKGLIRPNKGFGDWLQPYPKSGKHTNSDTSKPYIGTAYFYHTTKLMERIAQILGKPDDAKMYANLAAEIRVAFNKEYVREDGRIESDSQTAYLLAIAFGLLDDADLEKAKIHLVEAVKTADNHLRTGFVGTPLLAPVLSESGYPDIAYELLEKETYPSWIYPINQGATTMWERWNSYSHENGFGPVSMNSFNHYAYGAIGKWMYSTVAGINYDEAQPGYKNIVFAPVIGGSLENASAWHETPYGRASSSWKRDGDTLSWEIEIPANATGTIVFPTQNIDSITLNGKKVGKKELKNVKSGSYRIILKL